MLKESEDGKHKAVEARDGTYHWIHLCEHCGEFAVAQWLITDNREDGSCCTKRCYNEYKRIAEGRPPEVISPNAKKTDY